MTQFLVSTLADGQHVAFDALSDVLEFDGATQSAANVRVVQGASSISLTVAGKTIFLDDLSLGNLSLSNVTFADTSTLYAGDLVPLTTGDTLPLAYASTSSVTDDQYILLNGSSLLQAGSGDD